MTHAHLSQEPVLSADATFPVPRKGYRLSRLEVKNFGGYHGPASVFDLGLKGAVFSGDNGAGKSTAIDAYRMLFRTHPRFNSATQEQSKDRTVETYYIGQYGKRDTGSGTKVMALREHGIRAGFMAICGVFQTDTGETFSILRMAYFPAKGQPADWRLITAPADLSIERDFPEWPTKGVAARAAEAKGGELHANFKDFFASSGLAFGINNPEDAMAAFRFIDESIGVKKMASITGFARDNIFPRTSLAKSADAVITTFEEVRQSLQEISRCKAKIEALTEVTKKFGHLETALANHEDSVKRRARFEQFAALIERAHWGRLMRAAEAERVRLEAELAAAETEEVTARAEVQALDEAMREANYDKVDDYIVEKERKEKVLARVAARVKLLKEGYKSVGLNFRCAVESDLAEVRAELDQKIADVAKRRANVTASRQGLERTFYQAEMDKSAAAETLANLLRSKSAIEPKLLAARAEIAGALGIALSDMPFLAELVQIRAGEEAWEGVANRVLGGLGTELLVDAAHAAEARVLVNRGPDGVGRKGWGARIVIREIADMSPQTRARTARTTLAGKLEINPESGFAQVARALVDEHAAHDCVSEATFKTATGDACTKEGSVKKGNRIVKDDRRRIDDRASYVLGWNVQDRIDLAREALNKAEQTYNTAREQIEQSDGAIETLDRQRDALNKLSGNEIVFEDVDQKGLVQAIAALDAQIKALDNPEARQMRRRREEAANREAAARAAQKSLHGKIGAKSETAGVARQNRDKKSDQLAASVTSVGRASYADRQAYRAAARDTMGAKGVQAIGQHILASVAYDVAGLSARIDKKIQAATNSELNIAGATGRAKSAAEEFLRSYAEEGNLLELDGLFGDLGRADSLASARLVREGWISRHAQLKRDDLPRHEAAFAKRQKDFAKNTVETLDMQAKAYATRLNAMQEGLNSILKGLVYDPMEGTRARLRIRPSRDNDQVVKFQSRLSDAIKHLYADPKIVEDKTEAVIEMINDADTSEGVKRREIILDMRNWFEMDIEEYYSDADGEFVSQRRFWAGKDGESGGQGERLTMLLIGAGLAYTFGAHDETRANAGLQTVVLDEAFMHGSEEMAAAATEVLDAMGLQVVAATPVQKLQAFAGNAERIFDISKRGEQIRHVVSTYAQIAAEQEAIERQIESEIGEAA